MAYSIRSKILLSGGIPVFVAVLTYLAIAQRIFKEDKRTQIFESSRYTVDKLSEDYETGITRILERLEVLARLSAKSGNDLKTAQILMDQEKRFLLFQLVLEKDGKTRVIRELKAQTNLDRLGIDIVRLKTPEMMKSSAVPSDKGVVVENRSMGGEVIYWFYIPVNVPQLHSDQKVSVRLFFEGSLWQKKFERHQGYTEFYALTQDGKVFGHPDRVKVLSRADGVQVFSPRLLQVQEGARQKGTLEIENKKYLYFAHKTSLAGLTVLAVTDENIALSAGRILLEKAALLSLIIITFVVFLSMVFAESIGQPIARLVAATHRIAAGDLDTTIRIRTGDEIEALGTAFNQMAQDLKTQRERENQYMLRISEQYEALLTEQRLAEVGRLARSIGHEFGNILQPLLARLEILQEKAQQKSDPEDKTLIQEMIEATEMGARICKDLLSLSREHQTTRDPLVRVLPEELFNKALRLLKHDLKRKDAQVMMNVEPGIELHVQEQRILQVLLNLITNSLHAMSDGEKIELQAKKIGTEIQLSVTDTGKGISPENLKRLFEPLFTTKGERGNGLGLCTCRDIVEDNHGKIKIESELGRGTQVFIWFPAQVQSQAA